MVVKEKRSVIQQGQLGSLRDPSEVSPMPANVLLLATSALFPLKFHAYILVALVIKYFLYI